MKWLSRLEFKYNRYAIRNLTLYITGLNIAVFLLSYMIFGDPMSTINALALSRDLVLQGEVWRLFTFILLPQDYSPITILLTLYLFYMIGTTLQNYWGHFKLNIYYFVGVLGTIIAAFISGIGTTGFYLNMSLFLAYATLFPEQELMLFFVLPVKVKYLGIFEAVYVIYQMIQFARAGAWYMVAAAVASFVNYFIFFGGDFINWIRLRKQVNNNRKKFFDQVRPYQNNRRFFQ